MTQLTSKQQIHEFGRVMGKHRKGILVTSCLAIIVFDLTFVNNIVYAGKWIQCNRQPVSLYVGAGFPNFNRDPLSAYIKSKPSFFDEKMSFFTLGSSHELFCNQNQAKNAALKLVDIGQVHYK